VEEGRGMLIRETNKRDEKTVREKEGRDKDTRRLSKHREK
jgi:hypothetical protein